VTRPLLIAAALLCLHGSSRVSAQALAPQPSAKPDACIQAIAQTERKSGLPDGLLLAIAKVESDWRDPVSGYTGPWPWTVNAKGSDGFFHSQDEAMAHVAALLADDQDVIDIGCMQINLRYHPGAFKTLAQAFDPQANVEYGARFLLDLYAQTQSWNEAIRRYHARPGSPNGQLYLSRVMAAWRKNLNLPASPLIEPADPTPAPLIEAFEAFEAGKYRQALGKYAEILKLQPDERLALLGRAMSLDRLGRGEEAKEAYLRLLIQDPWNAAAIARLIEMSDALPPTRRIEALKELRAYATQSSEVPARLAMIHADLGDAAQAARYMEGALRLEPTRLAWRLNLALLLDKAGESQPAILAYERFLDEYRPERGPLPIALDEVRKRLAYLIGARKDARQDQAD
jgi:hypothetical protein